MTQQEVKTKKAVVQKNLFRFFKLVTSIVILYFLFNRLFINNKFQDLWFSFKSDFEFNSIVFLILCIILMPLNWFFESEKYRLLMNTFTKHSRKDAFKAILVGISFGVVTPVRLGEYGGRLLTEEASNNWNSVIATFVSSIAQNVLTFGMGIIALFLLIQHTNIFESNEWLVLLLAFMILTVLLIIYFNLKVFIKLVLRFSFFKKIKTLEVFNSESERVDKRVLRNVLAYAFMRYAIYATQYVLMLKFFQVHLALEDYFSGIGSIFLIQSGLPLPPLVNIFARGEIALTVWSLYGVNEIAVLLSTFSIWILNLMVPALIGLVLFLRINISKSLGLNLK